MIRLLPLASMVFCFGFRALAQPPAPANDSKVVQTRELDRLIDALANRNKPPRIGPLSATVYADRVDVASLFGKRYDWAEQDRVWNACHVLVKREGDELWPRLVEHSDDKRYAVTCVDISDDDNVMNITVGQICRDIAYNDLLLPFRGIWRSRPMFPGSIQVGGKFFIPPAWRDLKAWYGPQRGKSLWEMQVKLGAWAIKTVEEQETASDAWKADFFRTTKTQIDGLRKAKKPVVNNVGLNVFRRVAFFKPPHGQANPEMPYYPDASKTAPKTEDHGPKKPPPQDPFPSKKT